MVAGGDDDQAHSTLEVVSQQSRYHEAQQGNPLPSDPGKQVVPDGGKQLIENNGELEVALNRYHEAEQWKPFPSDPGKQVAPDGVKQPIEFNSELEVAPEEDVGRNKIDAHHVQARRLLASRRIILYGIVGLMVVLGAVLGGVLGSRHKSSVTALATPTSPSNSSATSSFVTPTQRNIAAVSFNSNSTNITRVYFQDDAGQIMEASNSDGDMTWSINQTGIRGKNGSVIAAAVSRPSLPLVSLVFFCQSSLANINRGNQCILS